MATTIVNLGETAAFIRFRQPFISEGSNKAKMGGVRGTLQGGTLVSAGGASPVVNIVPDPDTTRSLFVYESTTGQPFAATVEISGTQALDLSPLVPTTFVNIAIYVEYTTSQTTVVEIRTYTDAELAAAPEGPDLVVLGRVDLTGLTAGDPVPGGNIQNQKLATAFRPTTNLTTDLDTVNYTAQQTTVDARINAPPNPALLAISQVKYLSDDTTITEPILTDVAEEGTMYLPPGTYEWAPPPDPGFIKPTRPVHLIGEYRATRMDHAPERAKMAKVFPGTGAFDNRVPLAGKFENIFFTLSADATPDHFTLGNASAGPTEWIGADVELVNCYLDWGVCDVEANNVRMFNCVVGDDSGFVDPPLGPPGLRRGIIFASQVGGVVENCTFRAGASVGGAVRIENGDWKFVNCTFFSNDPVLETVLCTVSGASASFENCTIQHSGGSETQPALDFTQAPVFLKNCEVEGSWRAAACGGGGLIENTTFRVNGIGSSFPTTFQPGVILSGTLNTFSTYTGSMQVKNIRIVVDGLAKDVSGATQPQIRLGGTTSRMLVDGVYIHLDKDGGEADSIFLHSFSPILLQGDDQSHFKNIIIEGDDHEGWKSTPSGVNNPAIVEIDGATFGDLYVENLRFRDFEDQGAGGVGLTDGGLLSVNAANVNGVFVESTFDYDDIFYGIRIGGSANVQNVDWAGIFGNPGEPLIQVLGGGQFRNSYLRLSPGISQDLILVSGFESTVSDIWVDYSDSTRFVHVTGDLNLVHGIVSGAPPITAARVTAAITLSGGRNILTGSRITVESGLTYEAADDQNLIDNNIAVGDSGAATTSYGGASNVIGDNLIA